MTYFTHAFGALHGFINENRIDQDGIKVIIEVDGEAQAERFAYHIRQEHFIAVTPRPTGPATIRTGTMMGIPFEVRTSPRCSKCHK